MFDFTGPTTVYVFNGPSVEQIRAAMATELQPVKELIVSQFSDLRDQFAAFVADVDAKLAQLQASIDSANSESHLTAEDQAVLDDLKTQLAAARAAVGDANSDGDPAPASTDAPADAPADTTVE